MNGWRRGLAPRIAAALAVAAAGVFVLAMAVSGRTPAKAAPSPAPARSQPSPAGLGFVLSPAPGAVRLCASPSAVPPDAAPVVQVFADGGMALRRPAPLARGPGALAAAGDAVILLPARSLAALGPEARAALLDLLGQLIGERPVPPGRIRGADVDCPPAELAALLRWAR